MSTQTLKSWQFRILTASMIGYAGFYLTRGNMNLALCALQSEFCFSKCQLGMIITVFHLLYGFGKAVSGVVSDRSDARYFMTLGLLGTCAINFSITGVSTLSLFIAFWAANAVFQSMGWPPCARLLTQWFHERELGTNWALWNMSQQIGSLSVYLFGFIALSFENWRLMFWVPALIGFAIALFLFNRLRDNPSQVGLAPVQEDHPDDHHNSFYDFLLTKVYKNPLIWLICSANFFLYFTRMSLLTWAPTFFFEQHSHLDAVTHTSIYEISGMAGNLAAGYLSDRLRNSGLVGFLFMIGSSLGLLFLWGASGKFLIMLLLGFFMSGPQMLIGIIASQLVGKKAIGAATGLTGIFGYLGSALTGVGLGYVIDSFGWKTFFATIFVSSVISCLILLVTAVKLARHAE